MQQAFNKSYTRKYKGIYTMSLMSNMEAIITDPSEKNQTVY